MGPQSLGAVQDSRINQGKGPLAYSSGRKMASNLVIFPDILRGLLLERRLTPSQLATIAGTTTQSVEGWLSASHIPKATSVWAIARALGGHEEELLASTVSWYHEKLVSESPSDVILRFAKSASDYLGKTEWLAKLSEADQQRFFHVWSSILERKSRVFRTQKEDAVTSELIVLPKATIVVLDEWADIMNHIATDGSQLYQLPWKRFEDLISNLLEQYGWETTPMGYTKDDGVDIVAVRRVAPGVPLRMMVQCKRLATTRKVDVSVVREVWSVKSEKFFHQAMIATTSTFTRGAKQKGEKWDLTLQDHDAIVQWCRRLKLSTPKPPVP